MHTSECIVAPSSLPPPSRLPAPTHNARFTSNQSNKSSFVSLRQRQRAAASHGSLCLSRKIGESIVIPLPDGQKIVVMVSEYNGSRTSLRVLAPRAIRVVRREVLEGSEADEVTEIVGDCDLSQPNVPLLAGNVVVSPASGEVDERPPF